MSNPTTPFGSSGCAETMPEKFPDRPPEGCYPKVLSEAENKMIDVRRERAGIPKEVTQIGLALSGGGIRSATFCLGVLQALAGRKFLRRVDWLTTVSGGGYAGSFLGRMFTQDWIAKENPPMPKGMAEWPSDIKRTLDNKDKDFSAKRVESVLDDHRSTPLQWLRESGRYLSPTGSGDSLLAGAVSFRNWFAVMVVVITTWLTLFLFSATLRTLLWNWTIWRTEVETRLMAWTAGHWWWSPILILPLLVLLLFALPLGWSYWLTQKEHKNGLQIPPWWAVALILSVTGLAAAFPDSVYVGRKASLVAAVVALTAALTLVYYVIHYALAHKQKKKIWWTLLKFSVLCGGIGAQWFVKSGWMRGSAGAAAAIALFLLLLDASKRSQEHFNVMRNGLTRWFATAFIGMIALLVFAIVDSFGQMAYALWRPDNGPGMKGFLGVTGILALFTLARRMKLLLDQLPDRKTAQIPISLLAGAAAFVLAGSLLVGVSAVSHGFAWQWQNPVTINTFLTTNIVVATRANKAGIFASQTNIFFGTNIPALNLSKQLHGESRVQLTDQNLIQIADAPTEAPSQLAEGMSSPWAASAGFVCLLLAFFFGRTLTFLNLSSHQALYASRISRAYHGASNPERWFGDGQRIGESLMTDDVFWRAYRPDQQGGPLHIVNVTMNETVTGKSQIEYRDRQGMIVAVGPAGVSVGAPFHALWKDNDHGPAMDAVQPISLSGKLSWLKQAPKDSWQDRLRTKVAKLLRLDASHEKTQLLDSADAKVSEFGYHPLYGGKENSEGEPEQSIERLSLRQWIGISGAAFTTGLGKGTSVGKSVLLGLANIRLGYWWDSFIEPSARKKTSPQDYVQGNAIHDQIAAAFPVQAHLFDEFLAKFRGPNSRLWYLSDGGHFENTAAYELIRRRVPIIIVCDCGCDTDYEFEDLGQLVRMARVDFGAEIEFLNADALKKRGLGAPFGHPNDFDIHRQGEKTAKSGEQQTAGSESKEQAGEPEVRKRPQALLAHVWYPGVNHEPRAGGASLMLVLKPGLSKDEPLDVANYKSAYPDFPQETTLDQFFDEAQWESYRKLGRHITEKIFPKTGEPEWLTKVTPENS